MSVFFLAKRLRRDAMLDSLAKDGSWLTDIHISKACQLLKSQFPNVLGFQASVLSQKSMFKRIEGSYVQIINTNSNHWITVAGIHGSLVRVYDSKYKSISDDTKRQIALLTASDKDYITIALENTQFQHGPNDCGLYAIAYATDICFGNNPASYRLVTSYR